MSRPTRISSLARRPGALLRLGGAAAVATAIGATAFFSIGGPSDNPRPTVGATAATGIVQPGGGVAGVRRSGDNVAPAASGAGGSVTSAPGTTGGSGGTNDGASSPGSGGIGGGDNKKGQSNDQGASGPGNSFNQTNSRNNQSILSVPANMKPGDSASGTVDIANTGAQAGKFSLVRERLVDLPNATPALSGYLDLVVVDCGKPAATAGVCTPKGSALYSGKLGAMPTVNLGVFGKNEAHRYRFTISFPNGGTPPSNTTGDNAYQGRSTTAGFAWNAVSCPNANGNASSCG